MSLNPKTFFSNRINLYLSLILLCLLTIFAFIIPFVIVPGFDHTSPSTTSPSSITSPSLPFPSLPASHWAVIKTNFPDPCIIQHESNWYAFATRNNSLINIQVASAPINDISTWTLHEGVDALPQPGQWAALNASDIQVWAPSVTKRYDGSFVMFYSALSAERRGRHCIGAAIADHITGPYIAEDEPLICDFDAGGAIDPFYFHHPHHNTSYLLYKQDGNAIGSGGACSNSIQPNTPTPINVVRLSPSLLTLAGPPTTLIVNTPSDGPNIESPLLHYHDHISPNGTSIPAYYLIYNSGCFADQSYRLDRVTCFPSTASQPLEECDWQAAKTSSSRLRTSTLLRTGDTPAEVLAPGGAEIALSTGSGSGGTRDGQGWMVFHADLNPAWLESRGGDVERKGRRVRGMFVARIRFGSGIDTDGGEEELIRVDGLIEPGNGMD